MKPIPFARPALKKIALAAAAALALALSACEIPLLAGGSSSTETGKKIQYLGRVANGAGDGIPGVIVSLEGSKLADTTDLTGAYRVSGRSKTGGEGTLRFSLLGQILTRRNVNALQDDIPELRFVQRGFSGRLMTRERTVARIEGVVTGDGIAPGDSIKATFYHNAVAGNYSGFVYFPAPDTTVRSYAVRVDVFDGAGARLGRSASVSFNSLSGNIVIPDFGLNKAGASR